MENIRTRYAPSPTGYVHIGNLRTALYNYLFARHNNGKLIIRIEDTDQTRKVEGALENIIDTLNWAGIDYDEGPFKGGPYGPYMQSERLDIFKKHSEILINNKKAYYCFCLPERLTALREEQKNKKLPVTKYDKHCSKLSEDEINNNLSKNVPYVIRLNVEEGKVIKFSDFIYGEVEILSDFIDDQILIKSDGYPTYHLANVVDDYLMAISHVIRGEEWLTSTPKHILLYDAFGWKLPVFAHLPLLLNKDRTKLSKRQADVTVDDYRKKGYLKEALINFIALLGWTAGDGRELYELEELISTFSLDRVNKSGAVFDLEKLNWFNAEYLRKKSDEELLKMLCAQLKKSKYSSFLYSDKYLLQIIDVMKPRVEFVKDFLEKGFYFFEEPSKYEESAVKKRWTTQSSALLKRYAEKLSLSDALSKNEYEKVCIETAKEINADKGDIINPLRLAVSGVSGGPGVFDICAIIGKEKTIKRIYKIIEILV